MIVDLLEAGLQLFPFLWRFQDEGGQLLLLAKLCCVKRPGKLSA
jgi:hypothetical protein